MFILTICPDNKREKKSTQKVANKRASFASHVGTKIDSRKHLRS